ncbi:hypothetical protein AG1IA_01243 [Rhizoctonia solani AG-1 IA]|uniref:Uncharacterized protein n=1 Tax=Thanatephorus cucumeris (strain AG1-IA) TaxID=983506 RepID=L8X6P9_THACA|nr:hypothetical protein AG1IA_01243 [Rhizoctonia solani AG-1 IA]
MDTCRVTGILGRGRRGGGSPVNSLTSSWSARTSNPEKRSVCVYVCGGWEGSRGKGKGTILAMYSRVLEIRPPNPRLFPPFFDSTKLERKCYLEVKKRYRTREMRGNSWIRRLLAGNLGIPACGVAAGYLSQFEMSVCARPGLELGGWEHLTTGEMSFRCVDMMGGWGGVRLNFYATSRASYCQTRQSDWE